MRFLFLIHRDREAEAALTPDERRAIVGEHLAFSSMLREGGAYVHGEALDDPSSAVVVRPGEKPFVTDGPSTRRKKPSMASTFWSARAATRRSSSRAASHRAPARWSRCSRSSTSERG
jgi:hypothetical protein